MNTKHFFTLIMLLYSCTGCFDELQKPDKLWTVPISDTDINNPWLFFKNMPYYEGKILVQYQGNGKFGIRAVNAQTGDVEWEWNDLFPDDGGSTVYPNIYKSYCYFDTGRDIYVIDMNTGKTFWKYQLPKEINGSLTYPNNLLVDNKVFIALTSYEGTDAPNPYPTTPLTIEIDQKNSVSHSLFNEKGEIEYPLNLYSFVPYKNTAGEICLLFPYDIPKDNTRDRFGKYLNLQHFLASYNTTQKKYEYRDSVTYQFFQRSIMFENKVYGITSILPVNLGEPAKVTVVCFDPITRTTKWESTPPNLLGAYIAGGIDMAIFEKKLLINDDEYLVCYNIDKGEVLWQINEGGGSAQSSFVYLNGIVYWTNAGYLFAVELNTGKILLGESSKGHIEQHGSYDLTIGLIPPQNGGKGKIVVHDFKNAYAFEALR